MPPLVEWSRKFVGNGTVTAPYISGLNPIFCRLSLNVHPLSTTCKHPLFYYMQYTTPFSLSLAITEIDLSVPPFLA